MPRFASRLRWRLRWRFLWRVPATTGMPASPDVTRAAGEPDPHPALRAALSPWLRRLRFTHVLGTAAQAAVAVPAAALPWLLLDRYALEPTWRVVAAVAAGLALLAVVAMAARRAPGWRDAARVADRVAGLAEQAVTALAPLPGTPPDFVTLQRQRALRALAGTNPRQLPVTPRGWQRLAALAAVAVLLDTALLFWPNPLTPVRAEREQLRRAAVQAERQLDELRKELERQASEQRAAPSADPAAEQSLRQLQQALNELERRLEEARRDPSREALAAAAEAARRARDLAAVMQAGRPDGSDDRHGGGRGEAAAGREREAPTSGPRTGNETAAMARDLSQQLRAAGERVASGSGLTAGQRQALARAAGQLAARLGARGTAGGRGGSRDAGTAALADRLSRLASALTAGSTPSAADLEALADLAAALAEAETGPPPGPSSSMGALTAEQLAAIADALARAATAGQAMMAGAGGGQGGGGAPGGSGGPPGSGTGAGQTAGAGNAGATGTGSGGGSGGGQGGQGRGAGSGAGSGGSQGGGGGGGSGWGQGSAGSPLAGGLAPLPGAGGQAARLPGSNAPGSLSLPGWTQEPVTIRPGTAIPAARLRTEFAAEAALDLGEEPLPAELERLVEAYFSAGAGGFPAGSGGR